jgi:hypothetical protein
MSTHARTHARTHTHIFGIHDTNTNTNRCGSNQSLSYIENPKLTSKCRNKVHLFACLGAVISNYCTEDITRCRQILGTKEWKCCSSRLLLVSDKHEYISMRNQSLSSLLFTMHAVQYY